MSLEHLDLKANRMTSMQASGQASTLVTIPATSAGSGISQVDPTTGQVVTATPETLSMGGTLFASPVSLLFLGTSLSAG